MSLQDYDDDNVDGQNENPINNTDDSSGSVADFQTDENKPHDDSAEGSENGKGNSEQQEPEGEVPSSLSPEETKTTEKIGKPKKEHKIKTFTAVLIAVCAAFLAAIIACQTTFIVISQIYEKKLSNAYGNVSDFAELFEVADEFDENYIYTVDQDAINDALIRAYVAASGDKYAAYYSAEEWAKIRAENAGNSSGIGIYVVYADNGIYVAHVMEGSPAKEAQLADGDVIIAIDGQNVIDVGYDEAINLVAGEAGTDVKLTVLRDGKELVISVTRGSYEAETVIAWTVESNGHKMGYLKITQFLSITATQFKNTVNSLLESGCEGLIFDVRDNPGGQLDSIVSILDFLLPEGPIVHITDVDGNEMDVYKSDASEIDCPMVVIANEGTASAAELFTSSLKDYNKATIVGVKTYGKGCGQSGVSLSNGGVLYITYFLYNSPFSENYDKIGIYPDIEVEMAEEYSGVNLFLVPHEKDTQLQRAITELYALLTNGN